MDINTVIPLLTTGNLIGFFVKSFAIVLSLIYLLYAIVISRQTTVMNETIKTNVSGVLIFISLIQILVGVILTGYAILFI